MKGSSGWTLPAAAVVFGLALFLVYMSMVPITGSNIQSTAELVIPVFEADDEEPMANRREDDTPEPVLLPTSTETPSLEPREVANDPHASEAVEFVLQKPFAEAAELPGRLILPVADPPAFGSLPSENTPALSQEEPVQPPEDQYADEALLPVPPQTAPSDMPTGMEETSSQPPPPDLPADVGTAPHPLVPPDESGSTSDLPADSSLFTEDTTYLE